MKAAIDLHRLRRIVEKYQGKGPRYTSYPTAVDFTHDFGEVDYRRHLQQANCRENRPWSVYVHIPFCQKRCHFCACSVVASPKYSKVVPPYLDHLEREIALVSASVPERKEVVQIHFGGGTPSYLSPSDLAKVYEMIDRYFEVDLQADISIELDPRVTCRDHIDIAVANGCRRISIGVQDFDTEVQQAIGRQQSYEETREIVQYARKCGITSINVDLVYGLPSQSKNSLLSTVDQVYRLGVDRVALFGYAHLPLIRGNQRRISDALLPGVQDRIEMFVAAREQLLQLGYEAIGLDHFSLPSDGLFIAKQQQTLNRNFMGYIEGNDTELLGFGVTAIGEVGGCFVQNTDKLNEYYRQIDQGHFPIIKGLACTQDDLIRSRIIRDLMCFGQINRRNVCEREQITSFDDYFCDAIQKLSPLIDDGLVTDTGEEISLSEIGQLFVRNVAMCFDLRTFAGKQPTNGDDHDRCASPQQQQLINLGERPSKTRRQFSGTV